MKHICTVQQKDIAGGFAKTEKMKVTSAALPIIENTLAVLNLKQKLILLSKTNLNTYVTTGVRVEVKADSAVTFAIPAAAIKVLKDLPEDSAIEIWYNAPKFALRFICGSLKLNFTCPDPTGFPKTPVFTHTTEISVTAPVNFQKMLAIAGTFSSADDLRPALQGVYLTNKKVVASDGHRLVIIENPIDTPDFSALLPRDFIATITALEGTNHAKLRTDGTYVSFNDKITKVISLLISSPFPDFAAVLPKKSPHKWKVATDMLKGHVKLAVQIGNPKVNQIAVSISESEYLVLAEDLDIGRDFEMGGASKMNMEGLTAPFKFGINGKYLGDVLNLIDGKDVQILLIDPDKPVMMKESNYLFLLMPMKLSEPKVEEPTPESTPESTPEATPEPTPTEEPQAS